MRKRVSLLCFIIGGGFLIAGTWLSAEVGNQSGKATRTLSLEERVAYQRRVEEVYWRHNIWSNPTAKPKLEEVLPNAVLRARVEESLREGVALETRYGHSITAGQLKAEVERMARQTKQPDVLRELFDTLENDSFLIAEILARPALGKTLLNEMGAADEDLQIELQNQFASKQQPLDPEALFAAWWNLHKQEFGIEVTTFAQSFELPEIASGADDTWSTMSAPPFGGTDATAVWTGTEMIVWKGGTAQGTRYNPATDMMLPVLRTGAPLSRVRHTAVWTGTEMVIWGGYSSVAPLDEFKVGGRYNPLTETWTPTSAVNAPSVRTEHTAVWTGSEMIIWSGQDAITGAYLQSGGRYNPANDTWTTTSETNTPSGRTRHTAVWTGSEMIVWGGVSGNGGINTGGRYKPSSDSWEATNTAGAPSPRFNHSAVWTGTEMIIWGGNFDFTILNTGARYNPASDSWTPTSIPPLQARRLHTAVWTGTEMIVWGGCVDIQCSQSRDDGSRYNPSTDSWTPTATPTTNVPSRSRHAAVWTGTEMLVAGGCRSGECQNQVTTIGRYNPSANEWLPVTHPPIATPRQPHKAVWTGSEMLVWGVDAQLFDTSVYRFNPATNRWMRTFLAGAPDARFNYSLIWTGTEMIVWGGDVQGLGQTRTGARFNPMTDTWTETEINGSPSARDLHEATWTGAEMIIWGGYSGSVPTNTGGRYNPLTNTWTATSTANAPAGRILHTIVWSGEEMIVWGGSDLDISTTFNTGGRYNPGSNTWTATLIANAPTGRHSHTAIWTGEEMIIWGGKAANDSFFNTGGRYDPTTDAWTATNLTNAPSPRWIHSAVWTGTEMIVWGGLINNAFPFISTNTGGRYHVGADSWRPTSLLAAPDRRNAHTAVWTGSEMIIWGGSRDPESGYVNTGSIYEVESDPFPTPSPTATATATATPTATATATPTVAPTAMPSPTPTATAAVTPAATATPTPTSTPEPTPPPASKAINLSTRMFVQTGDNVGIGGFIITGTTAKHVLVRAIGPSLIGFGVPNALANPVLELHGPSGFVPISNDNWQEDPVQMALIQATGIPPTNAFESAIEARLPVGAYTAILRGVGNTSGVALVEVYDLNQTVDSKLANLSTRALARTGDNLVIAGFMLGGNSSNDRIVIRGLGPSLTAVGVPNALADPTLELRDNNGALLVSNNDWQENSAQASEISGAGLAPSSNFESAIAATLPPGLYTALLSGQNNSTGVGVVEVYDRGMAP